MPRLRSWRVRIARRVEDWIEIQADTKHDAEVEATKRPGVLQVFPGMTVSADDVPIPRQAGVRDDEPG